MAPVGAPAEAYDGAPGVHIPIGGSQAGKGRDHVDAAAGGDLPGQSLAVRGSGEEAQLVPEPLDHGAAYKDAALQGVLDWLVLTAGGDGGNEAAGARDGVLAAVHQKEAAGAVGVFGLSGLKAALPEQSGLLVAGDAADRDHLPKQGDLAKVAAGADHLGQKGPGNVQSGQKGRVPVQSMDIVEHGPGGVGPVRQVDPALRQLPEQPRVYGAEEKVPRLGLPPGVRYVVQDPFQLCGAEVGVRLKTGGLGDHGLQPPCLQLLAQRGGPAALPDDGVTDGKAGVPVPDHGGLPLIGDADGGDVPGVRAGFGHHLRHGGGLTGEDLHRVVLHPAGLGIELAEFPLGHTDGAAAAVE